MDDGFVRPVAFAQVVFRFREAGDIEHSFVPAAVIRPHDFAEVVVAHPDEFADRAGVVAYRYVVAGFMISLRAEQDAVRVTGVFGGVQAVRMDAVDVVVTRDVELIHKAVNIGSDEEVAGGGYRPRGVFLTGDGFQLLCDFDSLDALVRNFVAEHVQRDARVVPVAADHSTQVGFAPLIEIEVVGIGHFSVRTFRIAPFLPAVPFVENFVRHVKTERVAQIVEFGRERVMAEPNSITAHRFQRFESFLPYPERYGAAETTYVLVQAYPL